MKRCGKEVFVKILKKFKPCVRKKGHRGAMHSPDLTGEKFGYLTVIKQGKSTRYETITWIVKQESTGEIKTINGSYLRAGHNRGLRHGLSKRPGDKGCYPEYITVTTHYRKIFKNTDAKSKNYKGMPFYKDWDPERGGAYWKGVKWIINNLGRKPSPDWSLDIIERERGFVPGNLRWAKMDVQKLNQRHRKLGTYSVKEIQVEARRHGYKLVKI